MSDIPESSNPIQIEGAVTRAPVSESLIQSIGGAINKILKLGFKTATFTASGSFTVPSDVFNILVCGCGGGGSGFRETGGQPGPGGSGAPFGMQILPVTPGQVITVTIGDGGVYSSGPGTVGVDGADSAFGTVVFKGGRGGAKFIDANGVVSNNRNLLYFQNVPGQLGGGYWVDFNTDPTIRSKSQDSANFVGGTQSGDVGGGGAGPFGNGGNFNSPAAANTGGGGGGMFGVNGGDGGSGFIFIFYGAS